MNTKIVSFEKNNTAALQREAELLLKPLCEKYGVKVRSAGGSIDVSFAILKFEFRATSEEAEKNAFAEHCGLFGVTPDAYGRLAVINGEEWTFIGFNVSRPKFCVRVRSTKDGRESSFSDAVLAKYFHTGFEHTPGALSKNLTVVNPPARS